VFTIAARPDGPVSPHGAGKAACRISLVRRLAAGGQVGYD